jgi:hypothetical protein
MGCMQPKVDRFAGQSQPARMRPAFVDRESEAGRLREAILKRESMAICGPAGIGKTSLVLNVISSLPRELLPHCLYLRWVKDLPDLLRQLICILYEARDPNLRRQLHAEGVSAPTFKTWLKTLSSSRLRGTLYRTVEHADYRIFVDHPPQLTHAVAKAIKELFWMRDTPVYLLLRGDAQQVMGRCSHFFYWGAREQLVLGPLPAPAARELLKSCIERFGLSRLDLSDFREEILELSKQTPGAIVKMCALAADPRYQYGPRIKTKSVYIDYLMSGHDFAVQNFQINQRLSRGR